MNTSENKFDFLERLIFEENLKIQKLDFDVEAGLMFIVLNTNVILQQKISLYPGLGQATTAQLKEYKLIADGSGLHWPGLDEDLSLKGFLQTELRAMITKKNLAA